jgi:hypothetical protein
MRARYRRGLTLAEGIVALGLTVVMGVLIWKFIASSLGAHRKGQLSRSAQAGTREMISLLTSELRSASVPPLTSPTASTPVFWPGVWGSAQEGGDLGTFYPREESAVDDTTMDRVTNRLFYVRTADNPDETNMDPLASYALVELLVPETNPGMIERRVHSLAASPLLVAQSVQGADNAPRQGWALDTDEVTNLTPPANPDMIYDAGPDSRVAFRISHLQFEPAADPGRTRNPEIFDPAVFRIEVAVAYDPQLSSAVNQPWPTAEQWDTLRSEVTELRIPSVRSN